PMAMPAAPTSARSEPRDLTIAGPPKWFRGRSYEAVREVPWRECDGRVKSESDRWVSRGQRGAESRALAGRALHPDLVATRLDQVLHDREPQPGAALLARAPAIDAVEALEDAHAVGVGDARPAVGDVDPDRAILVTDSHVDALAGVG